jgi:biopolymer transport protein ExbD
MAFSFQQGGRRRRGGSAALAEINIVPLVDVVLVLLVIFMLTAHVMEFGLEVEVPKVKQVKDSVEELPVITITKSGEISLNGAPINIHRLGEEVRKRFPRHNAVYVRADRSAIWDPIAQVISALGEAKIEPRMVTQPVDEADR